MVRVIVIVLVMWAGVSCWERVGVSCWVWAQDAQWEDLSRGETDFKSVWVEPVDQKLILAACRSGVVKSEDGGGDWKSVLSIRGENRSVNFITFDHGVFYACTGNGLFRSDNQGRNWNRVFKGKKEWKA